jgi:flagellar hook protein FlgE
MSIGSISFWELDRNYWLQGKQRANSLAATTSVINAMGSAEAALGKGLAGIANQTALNRVNTQLSQEIQNVLSGNTGQPSSSTTASPTPTKTIPVAATGTGTKALSISTPLSLLGILSNGTITISAGKNLTTYTTTGTDTVGDLLKAINANDFGNAQVTASLSRSGNLVLTSKNTSDVFVVGGLYASNIGFGAGHNTFTPTKTTAPAQSTPATTQSPSKTGSTASTAKSYSTPATQMVSTAASLLGASGAAGSLVDMLS